MFKPKFILLEPLPRTLGMAEFTTPLLAVSETRLAENKLRAHVQAHGYCKLSVNPLMKLRPAYAIRISLNRVQVSVARCYYHGEIHAKRLADLVKLFFWKYRSRNLPEHLVEVDFNFPPAQAQADLTGEPAIVETLKLLEAKLIECRLLPSEADRAAFCKAQSDKARKGRPSANSEIKKLNEFLAAELTSIKDCLNRIEKGLFK